MVAKDYSDTKKTIIATAIKEIDTRGYKELSLRKLADSCGLTTGAFYRHFSSKDELFTSLMFEISADFIKENSHKKENLPKPREELLLLGKNIFNLFEKQGNLLDFLFFNPVSMTVYAQNNKEQDNFPLLNKVHQLIACIIKDESLDLDPSETFIKIWAFLQGYILLVHKGVTEFSQPLLASTLNSLLIKE
ncbi:TetR/AcrR family transcriptional regulator [Liquorilactobacillus capillatus]|uniref:HTH tetR-type domain-containing protein n=1 Tax=Liquorilactobacillus capillatus DSM 19910 TaxID=1423731 RepID=A0A0R1M0H7_9LACO|nr:TetR/AcrR family transcriptional regulator [Liquorilactobacillus capillatus]KRL01097.1 hypothetical protein FC81_GL001236 [Liquorilactobacillus capillatus DSM 19910]